MSPKFKRAHREPVKFKVACLVRQSLSGQAPLLLPRVRQSLRSADVPTCVVPRTLSSYGDRVYTAAGPRVWNSLPVQLCNPDITYDDTFLGGMNAAPCDF